MKSILRHSTEYKLIAEHYGERVAARSGVRLINHIHEGVAVLETLQASLGSILGFMLHPLVQDQVELECNMPKICRQEMLNTRALMLAMEYRHKANAYLCTVETDHWDAEQAKRNIGPIIGEVHMMLLADKMQNYKDFMLHHYGRHERSNQLDKYFNNWFRILGATEQDYRAMSHIMAGI